MTIPKTAHYRFANIIYDDTSIPPIKRGSTLEQHLQQCKTQYHNDPFPTFQFFDQSECLIASHETVNNKTQIHLIVYEQGASAAVVATLSGSSKVEINQAPPPNDREYIEAQVFILCKGNHVLWVSHNKPLRAGTIQALLKQLLETYLGSQTFPQILLIAIADPDNFKELLTDGISSIDLDLEGHREAFEYVQQNGKVEGAGFITHLSSLFKSDTNPSDAMDKMKTRISFRPGKLWSVQSIRTHLENIAIKAMENVNEVEEVTIVTKTGIRIKTSTLMVRESINVIGDKRLLDIPNTFSNLEVVYTNLCNRNLLNDS